MPVVVGQQGSLASSSAWASCKCFADNKISRATCGFAPFPPTQQERGLLLKSSFLLVPVVVGHQDRLAGSSAWASCRCFAENKINRATCRFAPFPPTQQERGLLLKSSFLLVPVVGVEPTRYRYQRILSPSRLPIPSYRRNYPIIISRCFSKIKCFLKNRQISFL